MTDPARVYAKKYADLEAERDRYKAALEEISDIDWDGMSQGCCSGIAEAALDPNNAAREGHGRLRGSPAAEDRRMTPAQQDVPRDPVRQRLPAREGAAGMSERMLPDDRFRPFSNGFEFRMWTDNNCARGEGGCRNWNPKASSSRDGCPMEVALALGSCTDGQIKAKHGLRCGILAPEGGMLVMADGDASTWRCPEYRGRDEPGDRLRRGPRAPADQMDLLDPRHAPTRERVIA